MKTQIRWSNGSARPITRSHLASTIAAMILSGILAGCGDNGDGYRVENTWASLASMNSAESMTAVHSLEIYRSAARVKSLPTPFFDQLIKAKAWIDVKPTSGGPSYRPGIFTGGTIYHPSVGTAPSQWTATDWSNFYNELFHAWWGNIFLKDARWSGLRKQFLENPVLIQKYRAAHPRNPKLALEEAWSETAASMLIIWYPRPYFDQDGRLLGYRNPDISKMAYKLNHTVAPVSHSDRPGFTAEAESTFPNEVEYAALFKSMFGSDLP